LADRGGVQARTVEVGREPGKKVAGKGWTRPAFSSNVPPF